MPDLRIWKKTESLEGQMEIGQERGVANQLQATITWRETVDIQSDQPAAASLMQDPAHPTAFPASFHLTIAHIAMTDRSTLYQYTLTDLAMDAI
jgi:hypothetical protein